MTKQDISYQDKLNELRLDIRHPKSKSKVFVCLEGESDVRLFRKLFNPDCKVENIPGGKLKLEECVSELLNTHNLIIGIRDADFLHLEGKSNTTKNIFLTDKHDMELVLVSTDEVFNAIMFEFTAQNQETHLKTRENLLKTITFVAYFRWLNEIERLEINFENLGFGDLIDLSNFKIDENAFILKALAHSPNAKIKDNTILKNKINALIDTKHDLFQLCNGHDFMKIFSIYLTNTSNDRGLSEKRIISQFRTSYTLQHYQRTKLHNDTIAWAISQICILY